MRCVRVVLLARVGRPRPTWHLFGRRSANIAGASAGPSSSSLEPSGCIPTCCHKLHATDGARLTAPDAVAVATTLADWGAIRTRAEIFGRLDLVDLPPHTVRWPRSGGAPVTCVGPP